MNPGVVYVLTSPSFDYLKIGATKGSPYVRLQQLNASSSAPTPFSLYYYHHFNDVFQAEAELHRRLAAHRINPGKEFFKIGVDKAVAAIVKLSNEGRESGARGGVGSYAEREPLPEGTRFVGYDEPRTPFSELFASFVESDSNELTHEEVARCRQLERSEARRYQ